MREGITKEQVFEAAERILAAGSTPTLRSVRNELGTGSLTTIGNALAEWKREQKKPEAVIRELAPTQIYERFEVLGNEIWSIALEMANERLRGEREALETVREEIEMQLKETMEASEDLAGEIETLKSLNEVHMSNLEMQGHDLYKADKEINELKQRITALEAENGQLKISLEFEQKQMDKHLVYLQEERNRNAELQEESKAVSIQNGILNEQLNRSVADLHKEKQLHADTLDSLKNQTIVATEYETQLKMVTDQLHKTEEKLEKAEHEIKEMLERRANRKSIKPEKTEGEH